MGSLWVPKNFDLILGHNRTDFHINLVFFTKIYGRSLQERLPSKDQRDRRDRAIERSDQHERGDRERKAGDRKEVTKR